MALPIPPEPVPRVLSVDDVALRRARRYILWHGLAGAVEKTVIAYSDCWRPDPATRPARTPAAAGGSPPARAIDERTRARHTAVHDLLGQGVGLLDCARRLGWLLNTVKRYARADTAEQLRRCR